jgi:hypothetical protein
VQVEVEGGGVILAGTLSADIAVTGGELAMRAVNNGPVTVGVQGRLVLDSMPASSTSFTMPFGELSVRHIEGSSQVPRIQVSGPVTLGGALSGALPPEALAAGTVFTIIDKTSPGPVTGTLGAHVEGAMFRFGDNEVRISYVGGDGNDVTLTVMASLRKYLLSEGATSDFFNTDIALANPDSLHRTVRLDFFLNSADFETVNVVVPAFSRKTVRVKDYPKLASAEFSIEVQAFTALPLLVERTMSWDAATGYGAHTERAAEALATTWYFAEGAQGFFKTFLLLANPDRFVGNVATVEYLRDGESPIVRAYTLQPHSRYTVDIGAESELVDRSFGMVVTFERPGMAERAMYFGDTPFLSGGHESAGVTAPAETWFVPEGATGLSNESFGALITSTSRSRWNARCIQRLPASPSGPPARARRLCGCSEGFAAYNRKLHAVRKSKIESWP